ncbi:MAG: hypothetical protein HY000_31505 [Planctomycetes bacterium]|nr:hypothetical protein [Planctomycetota bacterium]
MLIEQAIFTSARTDRAAGYQLVARSPGVNETDARELIMRGPSHDALAGAGADAASFNFHRLPGGSLAVSRTVLSGDEYSNRGAERVYTQILLVPSALLARFSNNPFAVWRAAVAQGSAAVHETPPERLEPLRLAGRAAAVDVSLLRELTSPATRGLLAAALSHLIRRQDLAIITNENRERLMEGLLNCLPVDLRTAFSFSTGLRISPRRPVQLSLLPPDASERRKLEREERVIVVSDEEVGSHAATNSGWAGFVAAMLAGGSLAAFKNRLAEAPAGLSLEEVNELGNKWLRELPTSTQPAPARQAVAPRTSAVDSPAPSNVLPFVREALEERDPDGWRRPDAGHPQFKRPAATSGKPPFGDLSDDPAVILGQHCPEAIQRLELLDDTVFEAVAGKSAALRKLQELWPEVLSQLGPELIEESRAQYLRHVLSVWRQYLDSDSLRDPSRAVSALDVMAILLGEEK